MQVGDYVVALQQALQEALLSRGRITADQLATQYERANRDWPFIHEVNAAHGFPPFLLFALGSRETNLTNVIGDGGNGAGVWQRDVQHGHPEGWMDDVRGQCEWSADHLDGKIKACGDLLGGVNSYNAGSCRTEATTGGDYGPDVLERREWLAANVALLEPTPVAPSAEKALSWLRSHLGTGESPPGSNHNFITVWSGLGDHPWCDSCFWASECVAWDCYDSRRLPGGYPIATDYSWGDAYVPSTRFHLRAAGRYSAVPTIGAAVVFVWAGASEVATLGALEPWAPVPGLPVDLEPPGPPELTRGPQPGPGLMDASAVAFEDIGDHIGRVEAWVDRAGNQRTDACVVSEWDRTVVTLEGNADNDLVRKRRPMSLIDGFGHMPYPVPEEEEFTMFIGDGPPERGGGVWQSDGVFRKPVRTSGTWATLGDDGARVAKHIGVFSVGAFDDLIDIEAVLVDIEAARDELIAMMTELRGTGGVDLSTIADRVAARVADMIADRLSE